MDVIVRRPGSTIAGMKRRIALVAALALAAGACSSDDSGSASETSPGDTIDTVVDESTPTDTDAVGSTPDTAAPETAPDTVPTESTPVDTATVDTGAPDTATVETGAPDSTGTGGVASALEAALNRSSEVVAYRVSGSQAQTLRLPSLDVEQVATLDPTQPVTITEVDADGEAMTTVDIGALSNGGQPTPSLDVVLDIWTDDEQLLLDLTDYEKLVEFDPTLADGPLRPGLASVDLATAEASGVEDIVALIAGQSLPSPADLSGLLEEGLPGATPVEGDPDSFTVATTYAEFVEATGQDVEVLARGIAEGVATTAGLDADVLTEIYVDTYREAPAEILVTIDDSGVDTIDLTTDLSAVWGRIAELADAQAPGGSGGAFDGGELLVEAFFDFEIDPAIDVVLPDGEFEDRTQEFIALFSD